MNPLGWLNRLVAQDSQCSFTPSCNLRRLYAFALEISPSTQGERDNAYQRPVFVGDFSKPVLLISSFSSEVNY
jgi:hypothetical protein